MRLKDKLLIQIKLPATQEEYEFRVPYDLTVEEGSRLAARILAARESAQYEATDDVDLMHLEGVGMGEILNPKETFRSLLLSERLVEGSRLMLV
ncbi:MAG: hypothetical protein IKF14_01520 [Atopobiaceae bacterium]|nr:hypothetical protein [Atopobiaceae bacterium]